MVRTINQALNERRRQQILKAATRCFVRNGFHQSTVQQICQEAGMSAGGLYRYYRAKDEIVVAIAEQERLENEVLIETLENASDPIAAIRKITGWILEAFEDPDYGRLGVEALSEASRNPRVAEALKTNEDELRDALRRALERGQRSGLVSEAFAPAELAEMVMSVFDGFAARGILNSDFQPKLYHDMLSTMFERLLSPTQ